MKFKRAVLLSIVLGLAAISYGCPHHYGHYDYYGGDYGPGYHHYDYYYNHDGRYYGYDSSPYFHRYGYHFPYHHRHGHHHGYHH